MVRGGVGGEKLLNDLERSIDLKRAIVESSIDGGSTRNDSVKLLFLKRLVCCFKRENERKERKKKKKKKTTTSTTMIVHDDRYLKYRYEILTLKIFYREDSFSSSFYPPPSSTFYFSLLFFLSSFVFLFFYIYIYVYTQRHIVDYSGCNVEIGKYQSIEREIYKSLEVISSTSCDLDTYSTREATHVPGLTRRSRVPPSVIRKRVKAKRSTHDFAKNLTFETLLRSLIGSHEPRSDPTEIAPFSSVKLQSVSYREFSTMQNAPHSFHSFDGCWNLKLPVTLRIVRKTSFPFYSKFHFPFLFFRGYFFDLAANRRILFPHSEVYQFVDRVCPLC